MKFSIGTVARACPDTGIVALRLLPRLAIESSVYHAPGVYLINTKCCISSSHDRIHGDAVMRCKALIS